MKTLSLTAIALLISITAYSQQNKPSTVFKTKSGTKYHTVCRYTRGGEEITIEQANALKLDKCALCTKIETTDPGEEITESIVCKGVTSKAEPCKLRTVDVSGYCHHHREQSEQVKK